MQDSQETQETKHEEHMEEAKDEEQPVAGDDSKRLQLRKREEVDWWIVTLR